MTNDLQMKTATYRAIAALTLLAAIIVPLECRARESGGASAARVAPIATNNLTQVTADAPAVPVFPCGAAATIWTSDLPVASNAIPLGLAMADFTGDSHPDLATIKLARFDSSTAQYVIEIQLTEGGHQSLRLTAPQGGLFITPKDVTGDGTLDLIVRSVGSQSPVAVFLNDGCGHFSAREPAPFARAIKDVPTESELTTTALFFGAPALGQGVYSVACQDESRSPLQQERRTLRFGSDRALYWLFSSFGSNRAPPAIA